MNGIAGIARRTIGEAMQMLDDLVPEDELARRAERVMCRICDLGFTVATAESCTGGLVAALLTDIEGCSHGFTCGFVTYSDESKSLLLGIDLRLIEMKGAVSEPVAREMAERARDRAGSTIAMSVTGFAGPTGTEGEEGLVHFALARQGAETRHEKREFGRRGRAEIRQLCLGTMLGMLEKAVGIDAPGAAG